MQEAWFRLERQGEPIGSLGGWLTWVVGRTCNDMVRSRSSRATAGLGDWESDPLVVDAFLAAAREGDFDALLRLLDPDVT